MASRARFVLVHGGFHGAWCWEKVIAALGDFGCQATAFDLPGHGARVKENATLERYRDAVLEQIEPGDILVAHSMGGVPVTLAADKAPHRIGGLIYLASSVPVHGRSFWDTFWLDDDKWEAFFGDAAARDVLPVPEKAIATTLFFQDCTPHDIDWAYARLTPQPAAPLLEPVPLKRFWETRLPARYIRCGADHAHPAHLEAYAIQRFGVPPLEIAGASHSPFISQPLVTALRLIEAALQMGKTPFSRSDPRL